MRTVQEHRRSARFKTSGCILVSLGDDSRLGEVLDVGLGGLAFRCIAGEEPSTTLGTLDVHCNDGLCLKNLPFKMIWNRGISDPPPFDYIITKRAGIQFDDLTQKQMASLRRFIRSHTTADPEN